MCVYIHIHMQSFYVKVYRAVTFLYKIVKETRPKQVLKWKINILEKNNKRKIVQRKCIKKLTTMKDSFFFSQCTQT